MNVKRWLFKIARYGDGTTADMNRVRQAVFTFTIALSMVAALNLIFGPQLYFMKPERIPTLRSGILIWALLHPLIWLLSHRRDPVLAYMLHIIGSIFVLAVVFRWVANLGKFELLGMHCIYQNIVMLEAWVLLPFPHCASLMVASVTYLVAETLFTFSVTESRSVAVVTAVLVPLLAMLMLLLLASFLLDRYNRRMKEFREELARHNDRLEVEVAQRTEIIERQKEQIFQMQKMDAIGRLAGGVAHDFNNVLTAILGYASELKLISKPGDDVRRASDVIERAGKRAAQLIKQLLGFARQGKLQSVPVNMHSIVNEVCDILSAPSNKRISIETRLIAQPPYALGDPTQLHQIVLNLALNARDAIPESGTLIFRTHLSCISHSQVNRPNEAHPGSYLVISVSDTGTGIKPEIRSKIYEPFFTTKKHGEGTGMGLAMVYGIVKNHGGYINLESEVGKGTTFEVFLPAVEEAPKSLPAGDSQAERGHILVVDKESSALDAFCDMLKTLGYRADRANNWTQAIAIYKEHKDTLDLVILDYGMPGMNGCECLRELKKIDPEIRVLLASKNELKESYPELTAEGVAGWVKKPCILPQLSEAICKVLF